MLNCSVSRVFSGPDRFKSIWKLGDSVCVTIPDLQLGGQPVKQGTRSRHAQRARAVFPVIRKLNRTPKVIGHQLYPVANAENRNSHPKDFGINLRRVFGKDAGRAARQDDPARLGLAYLIRPDPER
jgi:hypothetical protein